MAIAERTALAVAVKRVRPPMSADLDHPLEQGPAQQGMADPGPVAPEPGPVEAPRANKSSILRTIIEIVVIVSAAFVIALLVQAFLVKPFTIHQVSMRPTLQEGDRILLNRLTYRFRAEHRGDIVVFHSPITAGEDLVKRIVGIAGDRVAVSGGKLYINGVAQNEPYLLEQDFSGEMPEILVPVGDVFVMGDNRNNSGDSRLFGSIPTSSIIGEAFMVYWPISHWKTL
jgi:signal peptidase I